MAYPKRSIISLGMGVPGWICLVFLLIGLVFGTVASFQIAKGWRLQTAGVEVRGHVKSLTLRTHSCGKDNMDTCTSYDVSYFFDAGGKGQEAQALVAASFYAGLSEGLALPVRYVEYPS